MNIQVLAQAADPAGVLVQYGALGVGVLVLGLAVRALYARLAALADAERQRADRLEEELRATNRGIQELQLGVLAEVTKVLGQVLDELREDRR